MPRGYADANCGLHRRAQELAVRNESAARGLEEGRDATLTLHRVGVQDDLRRCLNTTDLIDSVMAQIEHTPQRVDFCCTSEQ